MVDSPCGSSALLIAPVAQLFCNLVDIGHCAGGHPDHEVEPLVLGRTNPLSIDGQECQAGCPRKSLVAVHQRVIPCQRMQQSGRLQCGGGPSTPTPPGPRSSFGASPRAAVRTWSSVRHSQQQGYWYSCRPRCRRRSATNPCPPITAALVCRQSAKWSRRTMGARDPKAAQKYRRDFVARACPPARNRPRSTKTTVAHHHRTGQDRCGSSQSSQPILTDQDLSALIGRR